jgi:transposase
MKSNLISKSHEGVISLKIEPTDTIAWKFAMLMEAATTKERTVEQIAHKFGYTREHFYIIKKHYEEGGSQALLDKPKGPKSNYKRTKDVEKQIIRHRFLDPDANCEVIAQKMNQTGYGISQRSVERTINEFGLQKKGYIKQLKKQRVKSPKS